MLAQAPPEGQRAQHHRQGEEGCGKPPAQPESAKDALIQAYRLDGVGAGRIAGGGEEEEGVVLNDGVEEDPEKEREEGEDEEAEAYAAPALKGGLWDQVVGPAFVPHGQDN